jgi:arylformamidase
MDAPVHFIHGASGLDEMPLTATMGQARVIQIDDPREITAGELRGHDLQPGERILFRTSNSDRCWQSSSFVEDFVGISEQAAVHLAEAKVRTVGVDYLSAVTGGRYEMICLPVKLHGSDGAPARAILRPIGA